MIECAAAPNSSVPCATASTPDPSERMSSIENIVGQSDAMQSIFRMVCKIARSDSTVLINGETGTGKGMVARAIHDESNRRGRPLVTINCGAIPENLLESELFGHVRGAFTGATAAKAGKFEAASGGTIFLDEIGDMSPDLQVKLLRVLEEGEFEPVGGCKTISTDVRVIAATHRDLEAAVEDGRFRADLFFRLYVIPLELPPLRERQDDIPLLVEHFLNDIGSRMATPVDGVSDGAMAVLIDHDWPGNVRELKNLMERLVVIHETGPIEVLDLPAKLRRGRNDLPAVPVNLSDDGINLTEAVSEFEKALIIQSLKKTNGVKNQAAKLLQMNRTTLVEKIKRHQLNIG